VKVAAIGAKTRPTDSTPAGPLHPEQRTPASGTEGPQRLPFLLHPDGAPVVFAVAAVYRRSDLRPGPHLPA